MAALALVLRTPPVARRYADVLATLQASLEQLLRVRGRTAYLSVDPSSAAPARPDAQALGLMALGTGDAPPQLLPKLAAGLAGGVCVHAGMHVNSQHNRRQRHWPDAAMV